MASLIWEAGTFRCPYVPLLSGWLDNWQWLIRIVVVVVVAAVVVAVVVVVVQ